MKRASGPLRLAIAVLAVVLAGAAHGLGSDPWAEDDVRRQAEEIRLRPTETPLPPASARLTSETGLKLSARDYRGAVNSADEALAVDPSNARALYLRAAALNLIGEYENAARDATRGLILRPTDPALLDARAWAYNRLGRHREAIADAGRALEMDPRDAYALANRAHAGEQRGDHEAMLADYKAAVAIDPLFKRASLDAARRHGLAADPDAADRAITRGAAREDRRLRSFALVLLSSLLGGLLIAAGALRLSAWRRAAGIEADYEIGRAIGQGGMGVVYEAVDRKLKRAVAIKMLRDEYKLDDAAKAGFIEEARTVAELQHPSIVAIHGVVEDARGLYLVFERLEGRTLDEILAEKGRLTLDDAKRVLGPVCAALEYAHARGVVHRDLKPGNVMLTVGGGVKVLDFGISRHADRAITRGSAASTRRQDAAEHSVTKSIVGTPHYMAPEQEYGVVRTENDIFSLGAMLYEMTTGVRPYEGSPDAKLAKAYPRASRRAPGIPLELDALIDRALEPDPEKRVPSPAEFRRQLAEIAAGSARENSRAS